MISWISQDVSLSSVVWDAFPFSFSVIVSRNLWKNIFLIKFYQKIAMYRVVLLMVRSCNCKRLVSKLRNQGLDFQGNYRKLVCHFVWSIKENTGTSLSVCWKNFTVNTRIGWWKIVKVWKLCVDFSYLFLLIIHTNFYQCIYTMRINKISHCWALFLE